MRRFCTLFLAVALSGCAFFFPKFQTPRLSVVNVQLVRSTLWEQQLRVRIRVDNPNDRQIPVKGLSYSLEVDGQQMAHGVSGASFVVPSLGEAEFDTNVTTNMAGLLVKFLTRASDPHGQSIDYHLTGRISLATGLLRSIPFDQTGSFKLQQ